jgi:hypothetical protein
VASAAQLSAVNRNPPATPRREKSPELWEASNAETTAGKGKHPFFSQYSKYSSAITTTSWHPSKQTLRTVVIHFFLFFLFFFPITEHTTTLPAESCCC